MTYPMRDDCWFSESEDDALPDLNYEEPDGFEIVGYWCWRGGGNVCDESCKSDSVTLLAQKGWATGVRRNIRYIYG